MDWKNPYRLKATRAIAVLILAALAVLVFNVREVLRSNTQVMTAPSFNGKLYTETRGGGEENRRVLFISSYEPTFISGTAEAHGVMETLQENGILCDIEYMQAHLDKTPEESLAFFEKIRRRMQDVHYDGIITADDAALVFVMQYQQQLFKDMPIVFMGVNDIDTAEAACQRDSITGSMEYADPASTVEAASRIMTRAQRVVGIVDSTPTGIGDQKIFHNMEEKFPEYEYELLNASTMTRKELGKRLETMNDKDIVIYIDAFDDIDGNQYTIQETASFIASHCPVPVFRSNAGGIGNGLLGGRFMDFKASAANAAEKMIAAFNGTDLNDVPLDQELYGMFVFDHDVMERFHVPASKLPKDAQVINYTPTYLEANGRILIPMMLIIAGLLVLMVMIFRSYQLSRRYSRRLAQSEKKLQDSNRELQYMSYHDALTGLYNRYWLEHVMEQYLGRPVTIVIAELSNYKYYADLFGHEEGEQLIALFASFLRRHCPQDSCFRYGENGFLVLVQADDVSGIRRICMQMKEDIVKEENIHQQGMDFAVGYASGIARNRDEFADMVRLADIHVLEARDMKDMKIAGMRYEPSILSAEDIEKQVLEHAERKNKDALTGFYNKDYFLAAMSGFLNSSLFKQIQNPLLLYFNFTNFTRYNAEHGFDEGDRLLHYMADILKKVFPDALSARFSDDHFVVFTNGESYEAKLKEVFDCLEQYRSDRRVRLKCGICRVQKDVSTIVQCEHAKAACDSIRTKKKDWQLFDEVLAMEETQRQYVLMHADDAIAEGLIIPYYQPIVEAGCGRVVDVEALARWIDPRFGIISPSIFIPVLEDNNEIFKVDLAMIRQVAKDLCAVKEKSITPVPVSINLSRRDFEENDMVLEVTRIMDQAGLDHSLLNIEITETVLLGDMDFARRIIDEFHKNGFQVWMDDFGSGYSSLSALHGLNFDVLKIDMKFMKNFSRASRNAIIVDETLRMARRLGVGTLTEGVENLDQAQLLREMGCEKLQGYAYAKPMPRREIESWLITDGSEEGFRLTQPSFRSV